jgi:2-C-methyl-D-erythritol 4-phosphate cytidylyltransferase
MSVALILAAGSGERLGADRPKALVELHGRPLLAWSLEALCRVEAIERIIVALPPGTELGSDLLAGALSPGAPPIETVAGGASRSESMHAALRAAPEGDPVLVHDAARPLLTSELAAAAIAALEGDESLDGVIAAVPVTDTIKRAGSDGVISQTLERAGLWAVQTPQVFRRGALERALGKAGAELARATDDAWLVERLGGRISVLAASTENLKVTTPMDLELAAMLLARRAERDA